MFKWLQPPGQTTKPPTKVVIRGVPPGSELARTIVHRYQAQISHFHRAQVSQAQLGSVPWHKKVAQFGPDLRLAFSSFMDQDRIDVELSEAALVDILNPQKEVIYPPERDIELRGYIAIHNANTSNSAPETASEAVTKWGLEINGVEIGDLMTVPQGTAVIYTFGGYKPNYHSWNDETNPNGYIGTPQPAYPNDEIYSRAYYPMYGFNKSNPPDTAFADFNFDLAEADGFRFPYGSIANTVVIDSSASALNLLGPNDVEVYEDTPDETEESPAYAWLYAEFFGRYAREVTSSWRFPYAQNNGVPRKILVNDDPLFWLSEVGGVGTLFKGKYYVGALNLDLSPPFFMSGNLPTGIPNMNDVYPFVKRYFDIFAPEGYDFSLVDPWP